MRALGFEVKKVDVLKILKDYDREGNGKITFEDFNEVGEFFLHFRQLKCQWLMMIHSVNKCIVTQFFSKYVDIFPQ